MKPNDLVLPTSLLLLLPPPLVSITFSLRALLLVPRVFKNTVKRYHRYTELLVRSVNIKSNRNKLLNASNERIWKGFLRGIL